MTLELLQHVRVLDPTSNTDHVVDVLIDNQIVQAIEPSIQPPDAAILRDCRGFILGTGLVDLYSHSGEPGFEDRETLASLSNAAIAGGFTRIHLLPDTQPSLDQPSSVEYAKSLAQTLTQRSPAPTHPQIQFWGALTHALQGHQMTDYIELAPHVIGFCDPTPITNSVLLKRILEYTAPLGKPIALTPSDLALANLGSVREGDDALRLGLPSIPEIAETAALAALLEIVEAANANVHIMGISTARSVELIAAAKDRGLQITASTPWTHLIFSTQDLYSYDPNLHLDPPLGLPQDQQVLREAVQSGILDAIAIKHHAYTYEEKTVPFSDSPSGTIGLELALPILWQTLVNSGQWTGLELWQSLSHRPATCLNQNPPQLTPGQPAEGLLFNPAALWHVSQATLQSQSQNTPFLNQDITGKVIQTWCPAQ